MNQKCVAMCSGGSPCNGWAVPGTDLPVRDPHGRGKQPVDAPKGDKKGRMHRSYGARDQVPMTIDEVIADPAATQTEFSEYVNRHTVDLSDETTAKWLVSFPGIRGTNSTRLGWLTVVLKRFSEDWNEGPVAEIAQASAEIEAERKDE
jgi:hypothetical protein